jgi:hypothetical protein
VRKGEGRLDKCVCDVGSGFIFGSYHLSVRYHFLILCIDPCRQVLVFSGMAEYMSMNIFL